MTWCVYPEWGGQWGVGQVVKTTAKTAQVCEWWMGHLRRHPSRKYLSEIVLVQSKDRALEIYAAIGASLKEQSIAEAPHRAALMDVQEHHLAKRKAIIEAARAEGADT